MSYINMTDKPLVCYHDDGKERFESHEIYVNYPHSMDFDTDCSGYGPTVEDALDEWKKRFKEKFEKFKEFADTVESITVDDLICVDCFGIPLKKKEIE